MLTSVSRGMPIDIDYLAQMADEINNISRAINGSSTSFSKVGQKKVSTFGKLIFWAGSKQVNVKSTVSAGVTSDLTFTFDGVSFAGTPYISVGLVNNNSSALGDSAVVTLRSPSASGVTARVRFTGEDQFSAIVNVIAIGLSQ